MKIVLPGIILFAIWSAICVRWYVCGVQELCGNNPEEIPPLASTIDDQTEPATLEDENVPDVPLSFEWSNWEPRMGADFSWYMDSLQAVFDEDPGAEVEIIGLYDPQELNNSNFDNLGLARAQAMKDLLLASGIKRSMAINSKVEDLSSGLGDKITNAVKYRLNTAITVNAYSVFRAGPKLTIHFPEQGTDLKAQTRVMSALRGLAQDAIKTQRTILVIGHTDNQGDAQENKVQGLIRATEVKDLLIAAGVPEPQVLVESEGEDVPISSNGTSRGRQINRRVEIVLI